MFKRNRISDRFKVKIPVSSEKLDKNSMITNMSMSGAFISTKQKVLIGEEIQFYAYISFIDTEIDLSGRVAWIYNNGSESGFGIEFADIDGINFDKLLQFNLTKNLAISEDI
ncbi:MAG: PilZ domain-containing protein [Pseudomonadota bacterium]